MSEFVNGETGEIVNAAHQYPSAIVVAIAKIMSADLYVQKKGRNQFHNYKYATVGDLLDKLQPLMADAGLVIFQNEIDKCLIDNGAVLEIRYQFTLAHTSGAVWPDRPVHTGMCSARNSKGGFDDKAANKCHTAARKYFLLGLFQVPTGEDYREPVNDGDSDNQPDPETPEETKKQIADFDADIKAKVFAATSVEMLDDLWKDGVNIRLRQIGVVDKAAQNRIIAYFSQKKNELLKREGSSDESKGKAA